MAEWVDNKLTIEGPASTIERFMERARGTDPFYAVENSNGSVDPTPRVQAFSFHALYPVPLNVLEESYPQYGYEWELDHWGCRWGARESAVEVISQNAVVYTFDTPAGPPVLLISNLAKEYDDLIFNLIYEGHGFVGFVNFKQGVAITSRHRAKENV